MNLPKPRRKALTDKRRRSGFPRHFQDGTETSNQVGVNLKQGYNGELTSRQAGSVGGQMVNNMTPARTAKFARADRTAVGHQTEVQYIASLSVF